jgi:hypothetical protein
LDEEWRLIYFQIPAERNAPLLISADAIASTAFTGQETEPLNSHHSGKWNIVIGGLEDLRAAFFYGAIAEIALFKGPLKKGEQLALTKYLKKKYRR